MYARHYHQYEPSGTSHILDLFRKMGWVPPSEDPKIIEKWDYYKNCGWNKND